MNHMYLANESPRYHLAVFMPTTYSFLLRITSLSPHLIPLFFVFGGHLFILQLPGLPRALLKLKLLL